MVYPWDFTEEMLREFPLKKLRVILYDIGAPPLLCGTEEDHISSTF